MCLCVQTPVLWHHQQLSTCSRAGPKTASGDPTPNVALEDAGSCASSCAGSKDDLEDPSKSTLQDYLRRVNETQREGKALMHPAADSAGPAEPVWQATTCVQLPSTWQS